MQTMISDDLRARMLLRGCDLDPATKTSARHFRDLVILGEAQAARHHTHKGHQLNSQEDLIIAQTLKPDQQELLDLIEAGFTAAQPFRLGQILRYGLEQPNADRPIAALPII